MDRLQSNWEKCVQGKRRPCLDFFGNGFELLAQLIHGQGKSDVFSNQGKDQAFGTSGLHFGVKPVDVSYKTFEIN